MSRVDRDNLTPTDRVELQIRACNQLHNIGDEQGFSNSVMALLGNIRPDLRQNVLNRKDEYAKTVQEWRYKQRNGRNLGTPESPVYTNLRTDDNYDPYLRQVKLVKKTMTDKDGKEYEAETKEETLGEPVLVSPILVEEPKIDYYELFVIIQDELYNAGQTWKKPSTGET